MIFLHGAYSLIFFFLRDSSSPSTSDCSSRKPNQEMEKLKCHPIVRKRNRESEPQSESGKGSLASVTWPAKNLILPVPKSQEPLCTLTPRWLVLSLTSSPTDLLSSSPSAPGPPRLPRCISCSALVKESPGGPGGNSPEVEAMFLQLLEASFSPGDSRLFSAGGREAL